MNYQFNYSFYDEWRKANPGIVRADMLNALEIQSDNGLKSWQEKERPMPILTILKICNSFQIPLSNFFVDMDDDPNGQMPMPKYDTNMQLEPDGGYKKERKPGKGAVIDPTAKVSRTTNIPEQYLQSSIMARKKIMEAVRAECEDTEHTSGSSDGTATVVQNIDLTALLELERTHAEQRKELMDIIKNQRQQIVELTNKLLRAQDKQSMRGYNYGMVAEDIQR